MRQTILYGLISILMALGLLTAVPAFAQGTQGPGGWGGPGHMMGSMMRRPPGVFGSVTVVSGNTITLQSKGFGKSATSTTTYSIDASNATVFKDGATSTVSSIAIGDNLMVQGTVSGTSVAATKIYDSMPQGKFGGGPGMRPQPSSFQGNGEPVIGGSITAVSGNTLTVTNKSNVTYTIDASGATILKGNATSSVADIATGDNVLVQGTVSGNTVTASSVIDQGVPKTPSGNGFAPHGIGGFFGVIGGLLQHLFGFF
ncbi:MAG TPA: DUF5666 domain-containing protein [Candidatus Paceibacterota bacterium]|nr:DUF5666 domain-containing protein [Candidatus Paceibacterota bacterium]